MKTLGIILVALGVIMMLITGFNFVTQKKVVDLGSVEINKDENHHVNWSPIVGGVLLVGGIVVLLTSKNKA